jgi:NAD(P)-dependent dehydrogenase (short-subunit alcohol dehydrogenase family)
MMKLEEKVAIITGAGRGIGRGIALAFAKEGAAIVIVEIDPESATAVEEEVRQLGVKVLAVVCDVANEQDVQAMVERTIREFDHIDILVNNAQRLGPPQSVENTDEASWDICFETGPKATWYCCKAVFPYMRSRGGKIINLGSHAGIGDGEGLAAYGAAKEAIRGFSRVAAREWGKYGINVNVIIPSAGGPARVAWEREHPEEAKKIAERTILKPWGDPEMDIGRAAVFLASEDSDYITGHTLAVDGGRHL